MQRFIKNTSFFTIALFIFLISAVSAKAQQPTPTPTGSPIEPITTVNIKVIPQDPGAISWYYKTKNTMGEVCDEAQYGVWGWVDLVDFSTSETNCWQKRIVLDEANSSSNFTWQNLGEIEGILDHRFLDTASHHVQAWTCNFSMCRWATPYDHEGRCAWTLQGTYNPNSTNGIDWIKTVATGTLILFAEVNNPPPVFNCN